MTDLRKAAEELIEAWDWDCSEPRNTVLRDLIEDIRQALSKPEKKMRIEGSGRFTLKPYPDGYESEQEFREAIRNASAQSDDFVYNEDKSYRLSPSTESFGIGDTPAKILEQEPVAWGMQRKDGVIIDVICPEEHSREPGDYTIPLYTEPPKRECVGLTKEEKFKVLKEFFGNSQGMIDAVEAKLKEKNT